MATGNFSISTGNTYISGYVEWTEKNISVANNTSDIELIAYLHRTNTYSGSPSRTYGGTFKRTFSCTGKDNIVVSDNGEYIIPNDKSYVEIARATFTSVPHNNDGTLSVTLGFQSTNSNNHSFAVPNTTSVVNLSTIPRASEPTCSSAVLGNQTTIYTNRKSTSFTHTIKVSIGGTTVETFTSVEDSKAWTPAVATYAPYISSTSATAIITCSTYNGNTKIGEDKTCSITLSIPSTLKPTATISISEGNSIMNSLGWGVYVQGRSQLAVTLNGSPAVGSTISSYSATVEGTEYNSRTFTSNTLKNSGNGSASGYVKDSRKISSSSVSSSYYVYAYNKPNISVSSVVRCLANGTENEEGTYLKCYFAASITSVNGKNKATFKIGYKKRSASSYTYTTLVNASTTTTSIDRTGTNYVLLGGGTIENTSEYVINFVAQDSFETISIERSVSTAPDLLNFNANGKALAIGKISEAGTNEKLLEIGIPTNFYQTKLSEVIGKTRVYDSAQGLTELCWFELGYFNSASGYCNFDAALLITSYAYDIYFGIIYVKNYNNSRIVGKNIVGNIDNTNLKLIMDSENKLHVYQRMTGNYYGVNETILTQTGFIMTGTKIGTALPTSGTSYDFTNI